MKKCFDCGRGLSWVLNTTGILNSEQFDAVKAGDAFAKCPWATHPSGNCYFNDTDGVNTLKVLPKKEPES